MLRVNCGLSRKVSRNYQSTGFSINLEQEISSDVHDPQAVVEEIKQVYDLAEEALAQEIERYQSTDAIASRDEEPRPSSRQAPAGRREAPGNGERRGEGRGNGQREEAATNKQIQYLLSIGKRMRLSTVQLEREVEAILGQQVGIYDLTKKQAGMVIDSLTAADNSRAR